MKRHVSRPINIAASIAEEMTGLHYNASCTPRNIVFERKRGELMHEARRTQKYFAIIKYENIKSCDDADLARRDRAFSYHTQRWYERSRCANHHRLKCRSKYYGQENWEATNVEAEKSPWRRWRLIRKNVICGLHAKSLLPSFDASRNSVDIFLYEHDARSIAVIEPCMTRGQIALTNRRIMTMPAA